MTKLSKGFFIVFEGLDGSGSSTQARLLKDVLARRYSQVYLTSEPTPGPVGSLIRLAMSHRLVLGCDSTLEDRQLAYLFAADRHDHLYNGVDGIRKQIEEGAIIISTRYYLSSYAYHCKTDEDFRLIEKLNEDFPPADLTLFIDCPVEVCLDRISQRQYLCEKYETREKLRAVRENYRRAIGSYRAPLHTVDGEQPVNQLHDEVLGIVNEYLCGMQSL